MLETVSYHIMERMIVILSDNKLTSFYQDLTYGIYSPTEAVNIVVRRALVDSLGISTLNIVKDINLIEAPSLFNVFTFSPEEYTRYSSILTSFKKYLQEQQNLLDKQLSEVTEQRLTDLLSNLDRFI